MQVKKYKYKHFVLIGLFTAFTVLMQAQNMLHPGVTFDLRFPSGSNVLEVSYESNRPEISGLNEFISYNRSSIQRGSSHLAIIAYMRQDQKDNLYAVNRASVLGSVVRSYLKTRHTLNNTHFTFVIRTDESASNQVRVEFRPNSVRRYENQDIFYTLKPTYKDLIYAITNYREIPYETVNKQNLTQMFPEEGQLYNIHESDKIDELLRRVKDLEKKTLQEEKSAQEGLMRRADDALKDVEVNPERAIIEESGRVEKEKETVLIQRETVANNQTQATNIQAQATNNQTQATNMQPQTTHIQYEKLFYKPVMAIKTNLMGFAGIIPPATITDPIFNLSAELFYAKRFSIIAEGFKAPFIDKTDINSQEWYKVSGVTLENRVYIGKSERFQGFYAGIYGLYGDFDIRDIKVSEKGKTGTFAGAGLSIGYSLPLYRGLTLEAGVRAGYRNDKYDTYVVNNGSFYISESLENGEFGLTGYNISISYRFGGYRRPGIK